MTRSSYAGHVVLWCLIGAALFLGRRLGALPFPDLTLLVFSGIYFFGALWIIRQRHGEGRLFVRLATLALLVSWAIELGFFLLPDSYPYTFATRPHWYVEMRSAVFFADAACPLLLLLLGGILPRSESSQKTGAG